MKSLKEGSINYYMGVNVEINSILETWKHLVMRKCGDEEDTTAIVRGATSRASWELQRLWRLETRHQEALTGVTATWGWKATAEIAVSKQTSSFICFDLRSGITHQKKTHNFRQPSILRIISQICPIYSNYWQYHFMCSFYDEHKTHFFKT